jgi:dCMP deaminase
MSDLTNQEEVLILDHMEELARGLSYCLKRKVAALLRSEDGYVTSIGINGVPLCKEKGCLRAGAESGSGLDKCRGVHAEILALFRGRDHAPGGTLYITHFPCSHCAPLIVKSGVSEVVYRYSYGDETMSTTILTEGGVIIRRGLDESSEEDKPVN